MKKILSLLGVASLALVLAVPAFAAAKPLGVFINGNKVSFNAGTPFMQNSTVLVPFRAVFEKLGLEVLWDARTGTVTGTGPDLVIKLRIGSNRGSVNGIVKKMSAAPVNIGSTTYIPLRFIGESTGGTVLWNPAAQSVEITSAPSKAQDEAEITALFSTMTTYFNEENAAGIHSLIAPESSFSGYASTLESTFQTYNFKSILDKLDILSTGADEAIAATIETSLRLSGPYIPDQQDQYIYTLVRTGGSWKISEVQLQQSSILLSSEQALKPAEIPQTELAAINKTLSSYYKSLNDEDLSGIMGIMTSYGADSDAQASLSFKQLFSRYNISYTPGISNIYYYSGSEAAVYAEQKTKESGEADTYEQGIILVLSKASDGSWKINQTYSVFDSLSQS